VSDEASSPPWHARVGQLTSGNALSRYLPAIGRFLIVVTFLEDALRIITQWNDQLLYLRDYRNSQTPPSLAAHLLHLPERSELGRIR
jgi:hypothetical protein